MSAAPAPARRQLARDCVLLLLLAAVPALLAGWLHPQRPAWSWEKPGVPEVEASEVARWSPPVLWLDARTAEAYRNAHVPGAILLNEDEWEKQLPGFLQVWQPATKVIVYCDSAACGASQAVALRLQRELQLTDVHVLKGGWSAWQKAQP